MKVLVVSNMYPDKSNPSYGVFVHRFCEELEKLQICYEKSVMLKRNSKVSKLAGYLKFYINTFVKCFLNDYDVIYIHYASHSSAPVIAARRFKKFNIITNVHGSDVVPENPKQVRMQRYTKTVIRYSQKVVVPSEYFKKYIQAKYSISEDNIYIYPSAGIDNEIFCRFPPEKKHELFKRFNLSKDKIRIGFIGRISPGKGWRTFVNAIEKLQENQVDFECVLVGSGPEDDELNQLIIGKELEECIHRFPLLGQEDLVAMYNCLSVLIFPTEREGESLGLVAIEAMACGTPVIGSDYAAPRYYIKDGVNGFKFVMGDSESLYNKIIKYINLPIQDKNRIKDSAIESASFYHRGVIQEQLQDIFEEKLL